MSDISLADVARALDAMLDDQMTGQARIAAHLVAAAEAAGHGAGRVIETLTEVVSTTVLDECWITDGEGLAYITTVRNADGAPVPFRFSPDPEVQPQASAFHPLLSSDPESDDVVAQGAQVREIDNEVFKYVGVAGVDRRRIVQVGNALAFEEQALQSGVYTSPVMTAVLAAFSEPDLLASARTSEYAEIGSVFEGLLGQQMIVQATLVACFVAAAEAAAWSAGRSTPGCGASRARVPSARSMWRRGAVRCCVPACRRVRWPPRTCRTPPTLDRSGTTRAAWWSTPSRSGRPMARSGSTSASPPPTRRGSCR